MMQASSLTSEAGPGGLKQSVPISSKRHLTRDATERVHQPRRRLPVARVLFGVPDPVTTKELFRKIYEAHQTEFRERWNFDPVAGLPCSPTTSSDSRNSDGGPRFIWTPISETFDTMTAADDDDASRSISFPPKIMSQPESKNTAVNNNNKSGEINQIIIESTISRTRSPARQPLSPNSSPNMKRFCSSTSPKQGLKQRYITDYMRNVKKQTGQTGREKRN